MKTLHLLSFKLLALALAVSFHANAALDTFSDEVMRDGSLLSSSGPEQDAALQRLSKKPRAKIVAVLREQLVDPIRPGVFHTIDALKLKELAPELRELARVSRDWQVFNSLNLMKLEPKMRNEIVQIYLARIDSHLNSQIKPDATTLLPVPAQMALVEGLGVMGKGLSNHQFQFLLEPSSRGEVHISVFRNFWATRDLEKPDEQVRRLQVIFKTAPYQMREEAMTLYKNLSLKERAPIAAAVQNLDCSIEKNDIVKRVCDQIAPKSGAAR